MTSQMDTAIAAARQLDDQASDYGDEVAGRDRPRLHSAG